MGNEVKGVQQEVVSASDLCIEIPQLGTKHSLKYFCNDGYCNLGLISENAIKQLVFNFKILFLRNEFLKK